MARPKEFDHDRAVMQAAALFGRLGYEATSVRQLLDELGLSASSFYAAFGGKEQLFMEVLAAHAKLERHQLLETLAEPGPFPAKYSALLAKLITELTSAGGSSSLTLRAAVELASTKAEVLEFLSGYVEDLIGMVAGLITTAARRREVSSRHAPEHLARFLLFSTLNLGFVAKVTSDPEVLGAYATIVLDALSADPRTPATAQEA